MVIGEEKVLANSPFVPGSWWKLWGPGGELDALVPGEKMELAIFRATGKPMVEVAALQVGTRQGYVVRGRLEGDSRSSWVFAMKAGKGAER